jgi:hypothetical protein
MTGASLNVVNLGSYLSPTSETKAKQDTFIGAKIITSLSGTTPTGTEEGFDWKLNQPNIQEIQANALIDAQKGLPNLLSQGVSASIISTYKGETWSNPVFENGFLQPTPTAFDTTYKLTGITNMDKFLESPLGFDVGMNQAKLYGEGYTNVKPIPIITNGELTGFEYTGEKSVTAQPKNLLTPIPSVLGGNAYFATGNKTASELIGEDIASHYNVFEGNFWEKRPKSENQFLQFGADIFTGGELWAFGTVTKGVEISIQGMNLFEQAGAHQTIKMYNVEQDFSSEFGSSIWNFGSTPAMVVATPYAVGAIGGLAGMGAVATGIAGRAAASSAVQFGIGGAFVGYSVLEGGSIKNAEGKQTEWNLGKGIGTGLGALVGFKVAADLLGGKNPSPIKLDKIPIIAKVTEPYKINIPIKEGTKIPFLGTTERGYIELPFVKKTINPGKDVSILYGQIGQENVFPIIARNPEGKLFFGNKPITTELEPTALIDFAPQNKMQWGVKYDVAKDYATKLKTKESNFYINEEGIITGGDMTVLKNIQPIESKISVERVNEAREVAKIVYNKEVPIKSSIQEISKLNPENEPYADYLAGKFKDYGVKVYGSQSAKLAGGLPNERIPADFDVFQSENALKFAFGAKPKAIRFRDEVIKGLNEQAKAKGQPHEFYINAKESELLIQQRNTLTGESRHFIDLHTEGYLTQANPGQMKQPPPFGFNTPKETRDIIGQKISTIGGEASNKLKSIVEFQKGGIFSPAKHRIEKDIGDAFSEARFAAKEGDQFFVNKAINKIIGKKSTADIEKVESLLGGIRKKLPENQRKALEEYELNYPSKGKSKTLLSSPKPSSKNMIFPSIVNVGKSGSYSPSSEYSSTPFSFSPSISQSKISGSISLIPSISMPSYQKPSKQSQSPYYKSSSESPFSPSPSPSPSISPYFSPSPSPSPSPSQYSPFSPSPSPSPSQSPYSSISKPSSIPSETPSKLGFGFGESGGFTLLGPTRGQRKQYTPDLTAGFFQIKVRGKAPTYNTAGIQPIYISGKPNQLVRHRAKQAKPFKPPTFNQKPFRMPNFGGLNSGYKAPKKQLNINLGGFSLFGKRRKRK